MQSQSSRTTGSRSTVSRTDAHDSTAGDTGPGTKAGRPRRALLKSGVMLAAAGLAIGGGFFVNGEVVAQERVAAVASAEAAETAAAEAADREHDRLLTNPAKNSASATLDDANVVLAASANKVDTAALTQVTSSLASFDVLPLGDITSLTEQTASETALVSAAATEADRVAAEAAAAAQAAAAAEAERVAAEAAQAAEAERVAAEAAASQQERRTTTATTNTSGDVRAIAAAMASSKYGWGSGEFSCLSNLWQKESGWNYLAVNSSSGATGIPQALPGNKMATAGSDWATNPTTQISWGLEYISSSRYGTPCAAWSHSQANNWY